MERSEATTVERIGTALIGLGKIATAHAEALASLPRSRFLAVLDNDSGRAHAFGERYGVHVYSSLDELLADPHVQGARLPLVSGEEGRKSVEIAAAIYKSQADRAPVRFPVV